MRDQIAQRDNGEIALEVAKLPLELHGLMFGCAVEAENSRDRFRQRIACCEA
jgi:hypothetical protein